MAKITVPNTNSEVRVTVRNPFAQNQIPPGAETTVYEGRVLTPHRWLTDREFCLTGDSRWPVRVINMGLVERLDFLQGSGRSVSTDVRTFTVKGSRGNAYTVTSTSSRWTCTCPGFQFRHACRHITELSQ